MCSRTTFTGIYTCFNVLRVRLSKACLNHPLTCLVKISFLYPSCTASYLHIHALYIQRIYIYPSKFFLSCQPIILVSSFNQRVCETEVENLIFIMITNGSGFSIPNGTRWEIFCLAQQSFCYSTVP
jgi:hypothetical protein